jgi:hypothetical protein
MENKFENFLEGDTFLVLKNYEEIMTKNDLVLLCRKSPSKKSHNPKYIIHISIFNITKNLMISHLFNDNILSILKYTVQRRVLIEKDYVFILNKKWRP